MLKDLYNEKHRFYHNIDHIENMFNYVDTWSEYPDEYDNIMYIAIWFHDSIYDPTRKDNEDKSVEFFQNSHTFQTLSVDDKMTIVAMIHATKDHSKMEDWKEAIPEHHHKVFEEFIDADLWELKKKDLPIHRTIEIEMSVFKEYGFVPFNIYKKERLKILEHLKNTMGLEVDDNINFLKMFRPHIGLYCGSFDPLHKGHYRIIERGGEIFDKVIVARGINPSKNREGINWSASGDGDYAFSDLKRAIPYHETVFYTDYQYDLIKRLKADGYKVTLIKGLRNSLDFSYEKKNHLLNEMIGVKSELGVETVFLFSEPEFESYSSSDIKMLLQSPKADVGYNMLHNPIKIDFSND